MCCPGAQTALMHWVVRVCREMHLSTVLAQMQDMMQPWVSAEGDWSAHNELHRLLAAHCDGGRDLLIPPDGKCAHCVAGLAEHRLLSCELL